MGPQAVPSTPRYQVVEASFLAAAMSSEQMPPPTLSEVAFAGRSNVGKSSLLNQLLSRKNLVRAGSTPGTTRQVNWFGAKLADGLELRFVDLPGYGFAKRSKVERRSWGALIEGYLAERVTLRAVVLIVDVRRGIEDDDRALIDFIVRVPPRSRPPVPVFLVATKLDKLSNSARKPRVAAIRDPRTGNTIGFSAETGEGRDAVWRAMRSAVLGNEAPIVPPT